MKLPNKYGSIYKEKGKRRKPYRVYITTGWNSEKQVRKSLGYVKSYQDGLKLLADYHNVPFNLDYKNLTFEYLWGVVDNKLENMVEEGKMSLSNLKGLRNAYKNHCKLLYKEKIMDLHHKQIQDMINNVNGGSVLKGYVKTVCVKIFNCAIVDYELPININIVSSLEIGNRSASNKHIPFTNEALITLLNNYYNEIVMTLLIQCFSGMRPNELFETDKEHIYINEDYIIGGSKTTAGKNRIIPIHPYIKPFIEYFLKKDSLYPFKEAINNFNYSKYGRMVKKLMLNLNIKHNNGQIPTAYDCRHTFTTLMKKANANEYILKRIVGHSIKDITEKTYTHRDIDELVREVQKIKLPYFDNFIEGVNLS